MEEEFVIFNHKMKKIGERSTREDACIAALAAEGCVGVRIKGRPGFKEILYELKMKEILRAHYSLEKL